MYIVLMVFPLPQTLQNSSQKSDQEPGQKYGPKSGG